MRLGVVALLVGLLGPLAAEARAQTEPVLRKHTIAGLERELNRRQQDLVGKTGASERWMDLLIRYHLGLSVDMDELCALSAEEETRSRADLEERLTENLDAVSRASAELEQRQRQLTALRKAIMERPARDPTDEWGPGIRNLQPPVSDDSHRPLTVPEPTDAAEAEEPEDKSAQLPPTSLIRGTIDPMHRGVAFFMAGQYEKAVASLEKATAAVKSPPLALFYLARAYEKLGDLARADGLYLQIEAQAGDREDGAGWTSAARTARQHMNWMRDHGEWRLPPIPKGSGQVSAPATATEVDLRDGFRAFVLASQRLEESHAALKRRAEAIDLELASTNRALEAALREKEAILHCLPVGVLAVSESAEVIWANPEGERLRQGGCGRRPAARRSAGGRVRARRVVLGGASRAVAGGRHLGGGRGSLADRGAGARGRSPGPTRRVVRAGARHGPRDQESRSTA